jgi:hypothetical protein
MASCTNITPGRKILRHQKREKQTETYLVPQSRWITTAYASSLHCRLAVTEFRQDVFDPSRAREPSKLRWEGTEVA